jgi:hypothetical protein
MRRIWIAPVLVVLTSLALGQGSDLCATATIIPTPGTFPGTNVGATASTAGTVGSCSTTGLDVWFSYLSTMPSSRVIASTCPPGSSSFSSAVDVFLGVCGAFTTSVCSTTWCQFNPTTPTVTGSRAITPPITAGTLVFIRVRGTTSTATGTFNLYVDEITASPPSNGTCATPIAIVDGNNPGLSNFNEPTANEAAFAAGACTTAGTRDVFFTYTATTSSGGTTIRSCLPLTSDPVPATNIRDTLIRVYATCAGGTPIACDDDGCGGTLSGQGTFLSSVSFCTTAGVTYIVRVNGFGTANEGTFNLEVLPGGPAPANDECTGAIALAPGENGPFTNEGACSSTTFITPVACAAGGAAHPGVGDVFFTYTARACDGAIDIATCDPPGFTGTNVDTQLMVYPISACPGGSSTPIACNDDSCGPSTFQSRILGMPVTGGATYLVRVAGWDALTGGTGGVGTFKITVTPHYAAKNQIAPGCTVGGGAGTPVLDLDAPPVLGSTRTLSITGAAPNAPGLLFFSPPSGGPTPVFDCFLWLNQGFLTFFLPVLTDGVGSWSVTGTVPSDPALNCSSLWLQGFLLPPFSNLQMTSTLEARLGP